MMKKKKKHTFLNIGTSSILLVFVLLCLVTFAILSIVNANMDYQLSKKNADHTRAYYQADLTAKQELAEIDDILYSAYKSQTFSDAASYYSYVIKLLSDAGDYTFDQDYSTPRMYFKVPIADNQILNVTLELQFPSKTGEQFYRVVTWNSQSDSTWEPESNVPVFNGSFESEF